MGISQSMIDSVLKACECLNHMHINCKSSLCSFDVDTHDTVTVDSLPSMSNVMSQGSLASVDDEDANMDSFRTIPPHGFIPINEHNHPIPRIIKH